MQCIHPELVPLYHGFLRGLVVLIGRLPNATDMPDLLPTMLHNILHTNLQCLYPINSISIDVIAASDLFPS